MLAVQNLNLRLTDDEPVENLLAYGPDGYQRKMNSVLKMDATIKVREHSIHGYDLNSKDISIVSGLCAVVLFRQRWPKRARSS
jgi:hypothetical protein